MQALSKFRELLDRLKNPPLSYPTIHPGIPPLRDYHLRIHLLLYPGLCGRYWCLVKCKEVFMDIGFAFLLGLLLGQWILLIAIWRVVSRLVELVTQNNGQIANQPGQQTMIIE